MKETETYQDTNAQEPTAAEAATAASAPATADAPASPEVPPEIRERAAKADELYDRLLRLTADFDNYKKRMARDKQEAQRFANEGLLTKLLPVLDNFENALSATQSQAAASEAVQAVQQGVAMIHAQLKSLLTEAGLEEINTAGQPFDPNWHEAVTQQESAEVPEGQVLTQLRKGYKYRERLLRPASVIVSRKPGS
jgi:molecular chaperone GrpE